MIVDRDEHSKAPRYCDGLCPPNTQQLTSDEAERGHLCDECADELDARERDAFNRRVHR